jgi:hypothetical protein
VAATFTMFGRAYLLSAVVTPDLFTPPATLQIALTNTVPTANSTVTQLLEPTAPSYARQTYDVGSEHWYPSGFGEYYNSAAIVYPMVTELWGRVAGWAAILPDIDECLTVGSIDDPYQTILGMVPRLDPGVVLLGIYD